MAKPKVIIPQDRLAAYDALISSREDIERKGKTTPYTSLNGHMFSFLSPEGVMGLRMSKEDREAFMEKFNVPLMEQHGRVMKEYVVIPDALLKDAGAMEGYLQQSHAYILTLKPKPTRK